MEIYFTNDLKKEYLRIKIKSINIFGLIIMRRKDIQQSKTRIDGGEMLYLLADNHLREKAYIGDLETYEV